MSESQREQIARILAADDKSGWRRFLAEADEIIEEAEDVLEWRFDIAWPDHTLRLAKLLASHHARQRNPLRDLFNRS